MSRPRLETLTHVAQFFDEQGRVTRHLLLHLQTAELRDDQSIIIQDPIIAAWGMRKDGEKRVDVFEVFQRRVGGRSE